MSQKSSKLIEIVKKYPNKPWIWNDISANPSIKFTDVIDNPDFAWSFIQLSSNICITLKDVTEHPEFPWSYQHVAGNPNIDLYEFIKFYENKKDIFDILNLDFIEIFSTTNSLSPEKIGDFSIEECIKHFDEDTLGFLISSLSINPNLDFSVVRKHKNLPWSYDDLSDNMTITISDVLEISQTDGLGQDSLNWSLLSMNPAIHVKDILKNDHLPWVWSHVVCNITAKVDDIKDVLQNVLRHKSIDDNSDFGRVDRDRTDRIDNADYINILLSYEDIKKINRDLSDYIANPKIEFHQLISANGINADMIESFSSNPNITLKIVDKFADNINWALLSSNILDAINRPYDLTKNKAFCKIYRKVYDQFPLVYKKRRHLVKFLEKKYKVMPTDLLELVSTFVI